MTFYLMLLWDCFILLLVSCAPLEIPLLHKYGELIHNKEKSY